MRFLVTGGTGSVGAQVVRELAASRHEILVLTRDASKARTLPDRVSVVTGDLREPATVRRVFDGVFGVFLLNAVSQTEANEALMAVSAMREAGVKRVVYMSVCHVDRAPWLPHFGAKVGVEFAVRQSGMAWTILRPGNFFQNDYAAKIELLEYSRYSTPLGRTGVSRVDVRDIAEAAAIALTTSGHEGQTYDIVGPDVMTGESTAQAWARALGRPVTYAGDDLDAWEAQMLQFMPDWMVYDIRMMFAHFQKEGLIATEEAIARTTKLVGHAPRSFDAFAAETAAAWTGAKPPMVSSPA